MDCEYHILGTLAYVKVITFFFKLKNLVTWLLYIIKWFFWYFYKAQIQKVFHFLSFYSFLCLSANNFPWEAKHIYAYENQEALCAVEKPRRLKKNNVNSKELAKS